jgi:uncharacterized membrane protein (UPF0182 family)
MRPRIPTWVALVLLVFGLILTGPIVAGIWTDLWWFESLGRETLFLRRLATQLTLASAAGLAALGLVGGSIRVALRAPTVPRPLRAVEGPDGARPDPRWPAWAGVGIVTAASAVAGGSRWQEAVLLVEGDSFGVRDPVWGLDVGFYVFDLPFIAWITRFVAGLLLVAGIGTLATLVARGVVRIQLAQHEGQLVASGVVVPQEVRRHLASLVAAILAIFAVQAYLARYEVLYDPSGLFAGPGWADLHGTIPILTARAVVTAVAAFLAFLAVDRGSVGGAIGAGLVLPGSFALLGRAVPAVLQSLSVAPSELSREAPQIIEHIAATRAAWDLDAIEEHELSGDTTLDLDAIRSNEPTLRSIRLWDHEPLLAAFSQVQEIRTYYGFVSVDNDRYVLDGEPRQIMLSPRELEIRALPPQARTWVNETLTYTHGYGIALGPVNEVTGEGLPRLWVRDLPPRVEPELVPLLSIDRPEIYFGEATNHVVVVDTATPEFDYPAGDGNQYTVYQGKDGVPLGVFGRLMFAVRLGSAEILLSRDLRRDSRVLIHRNILERARLIAPFFRYDADPYLVVDGGRLVWILDAYTTASTWPYAHAVPGVGNTIRNAAKVTIDAYDGTVTFWRTDSPDPIADAWAEAFPGLFRPIAELPDSLRAHLRYPTDLFALQAKLLATYHMQDHQVFYNREDEWQVPIIGTTSMEPYFTILRLPGESDEEFIQMLPFSPRGKPNLAAWMVARSDGDAYGQLRIYKFPKDTMVYGPEMVVARVNQDDVISEKISLWDQQGSQVVLGTLMVVPIGEALIYVQPLYLRAEQSSIPELKRVIVAWQNQIAMGETLEAAIAGLFGASDTATPGTVPTTPASGPDAEVPERYREAVGVWAEAQRAASNQDWEAFGDAMARLAILLEEDGLPRPVPDPTVE